MRGTSNLLERSLFDQWADARGITGPARDSAFVGWLGRAEVSGAEAAREEARATLVRAFKEALRVLES